MFKPHNIIIGEVRNGKIILFMFYLLNVINYLWVYYFNFI